jgi:aminoglycoside phosphotransferase (APT) family kinase protein
VLSHNDVNPTNLVYDGERLLLLDWDAAGLNDPFYDLAAVSVFLRMDAPTCEQLLSAYDGTPATSLPPRFLYNRRLVAAFCGTTFLHLARQGGHAGARGDETLESTTSLLELYQAMREGAVNVATAEGKWRFGLALLQYSLAL